MHHFQQPGHYIVTITRENTTTGGIGTCHLYVPVGDGGGESAEDEK